MRDVKTRYMKSLGGKALTRSIGDRIRGARRGARISQGALARHLGVTAGAVAQWERAGGTKPRIERLQVVAKVTKVSFDWPATGNGLATLPFSNAFQGRFSSSLWDAQSVPFTPMVSTKDSPMRIRNSQLQLAIEAIVASLIVPLSPANSPEVNV